MNRRQAEIRTDFKTLFTADYPDWSPSSLVTVTIKNGKGIVTIGDKKAEFDAKAFTGEVKGYGCSTKVTLYK